MFSEFGGPRWEPRPKLDGNTMLLPSPHTGKASFGSASSATRWPPGGPPVVPWSTLAGGDVFQETYRQDFTAP